MLIKQTVGGQMLVKMLVTIAISLQYLKKTQPNTGFDLCVFYPSVPQMSPLEIQQAALEGLALPHDLAIHAANFYQHGFGKPQMDKSRDGYRNR